MLATHKDSGRRYYPEIFLVSCAALILEVGYTRVFSYKLFYFFTYLIIGVALLGLGAGAVSIAVVPAMRKIRLSRLVASCATLAAVSTGVGYFVVANTTLDTFALWSTPWQSLRLMWMISFLFFSFFNIGIIVSALLSRRPAPINRLYFADLAGAAVGAAIIVPAMVLVTPPGTVAVAGVILCATALCAATQAERLIAWAAGGVGALLMVGVLVPQVLPDPTPDTNKSMYAYKDPSKEALFSAWSPVFRVDVTPHARKSDEVRVIHHDGFWGSTLHRFNGDLSTLSGFDHDERSFAFKVSEQAPRDVLIIGAAGGHEVLAGLYFGADKIAAVELNPVTVSLVTQHFADYTGHLADNPKVEYITGEGRSYLARHPTRYDLIFFVAPDSYAAMNAATSGAFVLTESYLYTAEMIKESLTHLLPGGMIAIHFGEFDYQNKPNRTTRYLATARAAFKDFGIADFPRHVLVGTTEGFMSTSTILLKKEEFSPTEVTRFLEQTKKVPGSTPRHAWGERFPVSPVTKVISLDDARLDRWYTDYQYNIGPITDDSPFFWHFARFGSVFANVTQRVKNVTGMDTEDSLGERVILFLLVFSTFFAAVLLLAPFVLIRRTWAQLPYKGRSGLYFALLGLGFMFYEITLIQKLTLFLGYPTYSLTVTLAGLLVFTGLGSLSSERYLEHRNTMLLVLLSALVALTLFYQFAMGDVLASLLGTSVPTRIAVAMVLIAPLGFIVGAFMPIGLASVASLTEHGAVYVAWGWAVNGLFSVIGSILTTLLSMAYGFNFVLSLAIVAYAIAVVTIRSVPVMRPQ